MPWGNAFLSIQAIVIGWFVWGWLHYAAWAGVIGPFALLSAILRDPQEDREPRKSRANSWMLLALGSTAWGPGAYFWLPPLWKWMLSLPNAPWPVSLSWRNGDYPLPYWIAGGVLSIALWLVLNRVLPAYSEHWRARLRKNTAAAREGKTDIRTVKKHLPNPSRVYDPEKYFKEGKLFFGLDEARKPIYVAYPAFGKQPHTQVGGTTGCGKGVYVGLRMAQALRHGEAVFVIDPKDDEWAPHLLSQECRQLGLPFALVDLRQDIPQLNILAGATVRQVEELLVAGLNLSDQGGDADHYRVSDRRAAGALVRSVLAENPNATLSDLAEAAEANDSLRQTAAGFVERLGEAAEGNALSATDGGADLMKTAANGGAVYVIGGSEGRLTVMQRMMLVRLQQIASGRDRTSGSYRQILLFLDEVKDLLSKPALDALAKIRDKGMHVILAHQSLGDFENVPGIKTSVVKSAIIENCKWSALYGVGDSDTAAWLADNTGKILVDDEARQVETTAALVERQTGTRTLRQTDRAHIDLNMWLALRDLPGVAVVSAGVSRQFAHICPLRVDKQPLRIVQGKLRSPQIVTPKKAGVLTVGEGNLPNDDF